MTANPDVALNAFHKLRRMQFPPPENHDVGVTAG